MRIVGISNRTRYWQQYVFDHPPDSYRYRRMVDIPWYSLGIGHQFLAHTKLFFPLRHADLFHTYNGIVANRHPWVIEVESYLPRYGRMSSDHRLHRWGLSRLASADCRAIIYTSRYTMARNLPKLEAAGVDPSKGTVIYRAVERYAPVPKDRDRFTILFAGNGFYRKGGVELLKAFERIGRNDVRLVIISRLEVDWRVYPDKDTKQYVVRMIAEHPGIEHFRDLPHDAVIEHMRRAHVFVGVTHDDPFLNTALEAIATGLPVLGSRNHSLPEIVEEGVNGSLFDLDGKNVDETADWLIGRLTMLMDDPERLEQWSQASIRIATERFDINVRNKALGALYDQAIG